MRSMFYHAAKFNQPIGSWNTSAVTDMSFLFYGARSLDQPIGAWDTGNVTTMENMFSLAVVFNQTWKTSAVKNMRDMFYGATSFDQPIGSWNTSEVVDMSSMFIAAVRFNQPIGEWDTSRVHDMSYMFEKALAFDQPLSHWDTSAVTNFSGMFFRASSFNQPVGLWDTSAATDMYRMFSGAHNFDQSVSTWNLTSIPDAQAMAEAFTGSGMSTCVLRLSSEVSGLPPSIRQTWQYQLCPSCPCQKTNLACVDEACRPVNSGFIELGRGAWDDRNASLTTAVGFRACVERCEDSECGAFLLEDSGRCWLMDDMNDQSELSLIGGHGRSYLAFRRASCRTFSCAEGTTRATTSRNASAATAAVTAASCCRCAAPNEVPIRSKEPVAWSCQSV
ncbi:Uncharacterized protein SCF082_LOCUS23951, partial [Durusdinium trenchii]